MPLGYKAGGRTKGTQNKRTQATIALLDRLQKEHGCLLTCLVLIANDKKQDASVRVQAADKALSYGSPKLKAVEVDLSEEVQERFGLRVVHARQSQVNGAAGEPHSAAQDTVMPEVLAGMLE